jgi:hypothetical protein
LTAILAVNEVNELVAATAVNEFVALRDCVLNADELANKPLTEILAV